MSASILTRDALQNLVDTLRRRGYTVVAPVINDGAIVYEEIDSIESLPQGWTDEQEAGTYRLRKRDDQALFGYNVGPASWKQFFHPTRMKLWQVATSGKGIELIANPDPAPRYALLGPRSCELHGMAIQDTVFTDALHADDDYLNRREECLVIAVNCNEAGNTCFCSSMGSGPECSSGFDVVLSERVNADSSDFLAEAGSEVGEALLQSITLLPASDHDKQQADEASAQAASQMGRAMNTEGLKALLQNNPESARWDAIAERCLSCANCTLVCPTCFCTDVEEVTDLKGEIAERWRRWDSCFTIDYSYIHGGSVRQSTSSRYRQWMTHKLAHWIDQFGSNGCVGCGRCITWCPVGIDITEEVTLMRQNHTPTEEA